MHTGYGSNVTMTSFIQLRRNWNHRPRSICHFNTISVFYFYTNNDFVHNPRKDRTGGGVGLYLADNFDFKCRPDLVFSCTDCAESLFVEINRPKEKNIIVGVVYRLHRYRRGQGFEFRTSLNFFRISFRKCISCVYNCDYLPSNDYCICQ